MKTIGERVRYLRLKRRLTQKELAEKTGITRANIIRIERGNERIYADSIIVLANFFIVSTDWLLVGDGGNDVRTVHSEDVVNRLQAAFDVMKGLQGEQLERVLEFIAFECSVGSVVGHQLVHRVLGGVDLSGC